MIKLLKLGYHITSTTEALISNYLVLIKCEVALSPVRLEIENRQQLLTCLFQFSKTSCVLIDAGRAFDQFGPGSFRDSLAAQ